MTSKREKTLRWARIEHVAAIVAWVLVVPSVVAALVLDDVRGWIAAVCFLVGGAIAEWSARVDRAEAAQLDEAVTRP